jgi:hypothetical protein
VHEARGISGVVDCGGKPDGTVRCPVARYNAPPVGSVGRAGRVRTPHWRACLVNPSGGIPGGPLPIDPRIGGREAPIRKSSAQGRSPLLIGRGTGPQVLSESGIDGAAGMGPVCRSRGVLLPAVEASSRPLVIIETSRRGRYQRGSAESHCAGEGAEGGNAGPFLRCRGHRLAEVP